MKKSKKSSISKLKFEKSVISKFGHLDKIKGMGNIEQASRPGIIITIEDVLF